MTTYRLIATDPTTVGDWQGQESLAAVQFDRLQSAIVSACTAADVDEDATREILSAAWDVWGSEPGLLTITDAQIATYVQAHVPAGGTVDERIAAHLADAGYGDDEIRAGLAYADAQDATDADARLSCALARILYTEAEVAGGARYPVEPGSI